MNDLTVLIIAVFVASLILYAVSFKMWWMVLLLGGALWGILKVITSFAGGLTEEELNPEMVEKAKRIVGNYLDKNGWMEYMI
jgi:hypothetical protein